MKAASFYILWCFRLECFDTLMTLNVKVKVIMKYFRSNSINSTVLTYFPLLCFR